MQDEGFYYNDIIVVGHITEIYGPVQAMHNYLVTRTVKYLFITHPFSYCTIQRSEALFFRNGKHRKSFKCIRIKGPKIIHYIKDVLFTFYIIFTQKKHVNLYVGIDCLNTFTGLLLRWLGRVDKVVFYVVDYTPKWVENRLLNFIYHLFDYTCARNADEVWNLSNRIQNIRLTQGVLADRNKVVPVGVELDKIRKVMPQEVMRKHFVVVSHLVKSKGIELAMDAWSEVKNVDKEARLLIIGTGPSENELKEYAKKLNLGGNIIFKGNMNHDELLKYLPTCGIGLAPYREDDSSFSWYADSTKPKEYLACGLPVIITRVPWIAEDIDKKQMGIAINYKKDDLEKAMIKLLRDEQFYKMCRRNAIDYASKLSWEQIYSKAFAGIF